MIKSHIDNLVYILKHKWYVLVAGLRLGGVPLWALIVHDWQKFTPTEWTGYTYWFFMPEGQRPDWAKEAFDRAWLHHIHCGPHHWDYWVLQGKPLEMPGRYCREMLADWNAMGLAGKTNARDWYISQQDNIQLHPNTREFVENELGICYE